MTTLKYYGPHVWRDINKMTPEEMNQETLEIVNVMRRQLGQPPLKDTSELSLNQTDLEMLMPPLRKKKRPTFWQRMKFAFGYADDE